MSRSPRSSSTYIVRKAEAPDREGIFAVESAAFGQTDEARLVERIEASARTIDGLSLVAEMDGMVIGHVLLSHVDVVTHVGAREVLALGPVAVHPERQRGGIGSALIGAGLQAADRLGEPLVVVLGHAGYYPRFGFVPASELGLQPPSDFAAANYFALALSAYDPSIRGHVQYGPEWSGGE